jgi:hypothetical protein
MTTPASPAPAAPVPPKSGNRTLIIVLCVILGLFLLVGGCVSTCVYFVGKKAKEYSAEMEKNPEMATVSTIVAFTPGVEVVSKDEAGKKITLRNKKTGETLTLDLSNFSAENMGKAIEQFSKGQKVTAVAGESGVSSSATDSASSSAGMLSITPAKAAAMEANVKKFPDFVAAYAGATTLEATTTMVGSGTVGSYVFLTSDAPDKVTDFYAQKLTQAGLTITGKTSDANDNGPTSTLVSTAENPERSVPVNAETQPGGKVRVTVGFTAAK